MGPAFSTFGERRRIYRILVGTPEGKGPLRSPRHRLEINIQKDLQGSER